jgi:hypothetical protein
MIGFDRRASPAGRRKLARTIGQNVPAAVSTQSSNDNPDTISCLIIHSSRAARVNRYNYTLHPRQCCPEADFAGPVRETPTVCRA